MGSKNTKKIKKRRLKLKGALIILLFLSIIIFSAFTLYNMPIKNIRITGTTILSDIEIIELANIKDYPALFQLDKTNIKKDLQNLDLVNSVTIKRSLNGTIEINIEENKVLFYNKSKNVAVLSNGEEVELKQDYLGIPTLVNYVKDVVYEKLVQGLDKIDYEIIGLISEIEYSPFKSGDIVIDDTRFLLRMNDGNELYVNIINISKLDSYRKIFASLEEQNRRIYLDSSSDSITTEPITKKVEEEVNED